MTGSADVVVAGGSREHVPGPDTRQLFRADPPQWGKTSGAYPEHGPGQRDLGRETTYPLKDPDAFACCAATNGAGTSPKLAVGFDGPIRAVWKLTDWSATAPAQRPVPDVTCDEGIRSDTRPRKLPPLRPCPQSGTVTAGNSSQMSDRARGGVMTKIRPERRLVPPVQMPSLPPRRGVDPETMGIGPVLPCPRH